MPLRNYCLVSRVNVTDGNGVVPDIQVPLANAGIGIGIPDDKTLSELSRENGRSLLVFTILLEVRIMVGSSVVR